MEMEIEMEMHNIDYVYLLITVSRLLSDNIFDRNSIKILIGIQMPSDFPTRFQNSGA